MAYVDLDKVINVDGTTTSGGGIGGVDDPYVYPTSPKMIAFNVPPTVIDADTSVQKRVPALDAAYHGVATSNNAAYIASVVEGTGALSIKSKTYDFASNINKIVDGEVKGRLYTKTINNFNVDNAGLITKAGISVFKNSAYFSSKKTMLVNSGGNYFVVGYLSNDMVVYSSDADGNITNNTATSTLEISPTNRFVFNIAGVKGNSVFLAVLRRNFGLENVSGNHYIGHCRSGLDLLKYNVSTTGIITLSNTNVLVNVGSDIPQGFLNPTIIGSNSSGHTIGTHQINDDIYIFAHSYNYHQERENGGSGTGFLYQNGTFIYAGSIDVNTEISTNIYTTSFTSQLNGYSAIPPTNDQGTIVSGITKVFCNVGYNTTHLLFDRGADIYQINSGGFTDTTVNNIYDISVDNTSIAKMGGTADNFGVSGNNVLNVNGTGAPNISEGPTMISYVSCLFTELGFSCFLQNRFFNVLADDYSDIVNVDINGTNYTSLAIGKSKNSFIDGEIISDITTVLSDIIISDTSVSIEYTHNTGSYTNMKLGFGLTGGTYDAPTGTNDASGDGTAGRDVGANGMYLNLELT